MRILGCLFLLVVSASASAGDCMTHPVWVHDVVIRSCEVLDAKNASSVTSPGHDPEEIAKWSKGAILKVTEKRRRAIEVDNPWLPSPTALPWFKPKMKDVTYLYRSADPNVCSTFPRRARIKVASFTDCSCDTGDWCRPLAVLQVSVVPPQFEKFSR
jgi:hypothetical protein